MRYATALVAALALGATASLYTPRADAGVVVSVGIPVPVVAPAVVATPAPYYPYVAPPFVGFGCCRAPYFAHPYYGAHFYAPGFYRPGYVHGAYLRGGYVHGGVAYRGYRR